VPEIANQVPHLAITWERDLTVESIVSALRDGEPRIEVRPITPGERRIEVGVWMMRPGEEAVVGQRCAEILRASRL
jgi:hypothetical protein